ncbi:MAG: SDR family oxidoreductase [Micropruina sp.]|uniref:SDR family oxidoreductase n=1 Tax=Micropruina sp. TaxID=2737536 RepID=UPI0039E5559F
MTRRVAVVGGSGRLGARVVRALGEQGASAVSLSRRTGFDLSRSGPDDLARALDGSDAVIDCSDAADRSVATFEASAGRLAVAAGRADVRQLVAVSIVGIDRPGLARMGYYQGKLAQERALRAAALPVGIVRTTQWYTFADQVYAGVGLGRFGRVGVAPTMRMQPVSTDAVAARLARAALEGLPDGRVELAGPQPMSLAELVRRLWRARGVRVRVIQLTIPGGRGFGIPGFADGSLLPGPDAEIDPTTVEEWARTEHLSRPAGIQQLGEPGQDAWGSVRDTALRNFGSDGRAG